jgi:hypothetical protein
MKNLEEIVLRNRESFDDQEPKDDHFEKFQSRLKKQSTITIKLSFSNFMKAAAVVALIVTGSIWIYISQEKSQVAYNGYTQEIKEVEFYYTNLVDDRMTEINEYSKDPELKNELLNKEFREIDSLYTVLQNELKSAPGDERIINAIIQHYQVKVEILNEILNDLQSIKPDKTRNHENTQI